MTHTSLHVIGPEQAILDRDGTEIFWAVPPKFRDGTASNLVLMGRNLGTARAVPAVPPTPGLFWDGILFEDALLGGRKPRVGHMVCS